MIQTKYRKGVAKRLGSYLRTLRKQKGWTQTTAGSAVGVDAVTVRRWELGSFSPSSNRIGRVAEVYGVDVSTLIDVAETAVHDESNTLFKIRGYLEAGTAPTPETDHLGTISLPSRMVQENPQDFFLIVNGDSLVSDGIHDGDALLICPSQPPRTGGLCVAEKDGRLYAGTYITPDHLRVRTNTGTTIDLALADSRLVGAVGWQVRKM